MTFTPIEGVHFNAPYSPPASSPPSSGGGGGGGGGTPAITPTNLYNITTGQSTTGTITQAMSNAGWVIGNAPTGTNNAPIVSSSGTSGAGFADTANLIGLGGETGWASSASPTIAFPKIEPNVVATTTQKASEQALGIQAALDRIEAGTPGEKDQENIDLAKSGGAVATMVSADGTKTIQVAVGSQRASDLFGQGYTLGNKPGGGTMTAEELEASQTGANVNAVPGDDIVGDTAATNSANQAIADIEARLKLIQDTKTEAQKKDDDFTQTILDSLEETAGKSAFESQQDALLVDPLEAQLTSINNQIQTKEADKNRLLADIQGKPITMNSIIGSQAQVRAVLNAEIFTLSAQANVLMNNITLAEKNVQDAVKAKYGVIEERISIAQAQRNAIRDIVTRDEKAQLDALDAIDAEKKQAIADAKADDLFIERLKLEAIGNGASMAEANKITGTREQALGAFADSGFATKPVTGGGTGASFTPTEKKKLEQAGLINAPRDQQLDFLFGGDGDGFETGFEDLTDDEIGTILQNNTDKNGDFDASKLSNDEIIEAQRRGFFAEDDEETKDTLDKIISTVLNPLETMKSGFDIIKDKVQSNL